MQLSNRLALLLVLCLLPALSCDDETAPGIPITLETIWPNENGLAWDYSLVQTTFPELQILDSAAIYPDPNDVPPAPSIHAILPLIDDPSLPDSIQTATQVWTLQFQDSTTTEWGGTFQHLIEIPETRSPAISLTSSAGTRAETPFFQGLLRARPDLAIRVLGHAVPMSARIDPSDLGYPIFLHGGAWQKTASWIGMYSDLSNGLYWKYLDSNLSLGHSFTHPLTPLAEDVYLHGLIRRKVTATTPLGKFTNALEVVYLVDYGVAAVTDAGSPEPFGYFRMILYGKVIYVPTVGPVSLYERDLVTVGSVLGRGAGDRALEITGLRTEPLPFKAGLKT